jgi:hypothetical protein
MAETKCEKALVTPTGIKYNELYYSCSKAIKHQWFEYAWVNGDWEIKVTIENNDLDRIFLIDEVTKEREVCNIILGQTLNDVKLQRYFNSIKKLKRRKKLMRQV